MQSGSNSTGTSVQLKSAPVAWLRPSKNWNPEHSNRVSVSDDHGSADVNPPLSGISFFRPKKEELQREVRRSGSWIRSSASALAEECHSRRVLGFISAFSPHLSHLSHFREAMAILQGLLCAEESFIGQSGEPAFVRRVSGSFTPLQNQQKTELPFYRCLVALEHMHFPSLSSAISECVTAAISAAAVVSLAFFFF